MRNVKQHTQSEPYSLPTVILSLTKDATLDQGYIRFMRSYFVYILRCADGAFYIGFTNDIERRLSEHNSGTAFSYTRKRRPIRLVYCTELYDVYAAIALEKKYKRWSKNKKLALIQGKQSQLEWLALNPAMKKIRMMVSMVRQAHHDNVKGVFPQAHHDNFDC